MPPHFSIAIRIF